MVVAQEAGTEEAAAATEGRQEEVTEADPEAEATEVAPEAEATEVAPRTAERQGIPG